MSSPIGPPPPGGDLNRASEVYAFTWTLISVALILVVGRMYSRIKLTRNVWWDDWCVCISLVLDFVIAAMWTVYAGRGYARHVYYLSPTEIRDALKLSPISRTICIVAIAAGKISVAFLIERIVGPSKWRKWMLRAISISIAATSFIVVLFFYIQCQPTRAFWDKGLVKMRKGHCWDPIPINRLNLAVASYWTFLNFALAMIPLDIVWKLQMSKQNRVWLSLLLSMGVFAGICAAVKTSKIPIAVRPKVDFTWDTIELFLWNAMEMNVIIIAACIPTLRPIYLILFSKPGASHYGSRPSKNHRNSHYKRTADSTTASSKSKSRGGSIIGLTKFSGGKKKEGLVVNEVAVAGTPQRDERMDSRDSRDRTETGADIESDGGMEVVGLGEMRIQEEERGGWGEVR